MRPSGIRRESRSSMAGSALIAAVIAGEYAIGETAFTVMRCAAHSRARLFAKPRSAPFIVAYSGSVALPSTPAGEVMTRKVPPCFRRASNAAVAQCRAPRSDTAKCCSQSPRSTACSSCGWLDKLLVALCTTASRRPVVVTATSTASATAAASVTSQQAHVAMCPRDVISSTVASPVCDRVATITCAPSEAKASAMPRPTPAPAPVTRAVRPESVTAASSIRHRR